MNVPASVINARIKHWTAQSGTAALTDQLAVAGLRYASELEDTLQESTGLKAHRYCKYPVEGAAARLVHVSYLWGIPVGITDAEYNVDMSHIVVGLFPVEDLLNQDMEFRSELEGSIRSYFKIFINTSQHTRSFEKYESRIKAIGIKMPESIRLKIKAYLQRDESPPECP